MQSASIPVELSPANHPAILVARRLVSQNTDALRCEFFRLLTPDDTLFYKVTGGDAATGNYSFGSMYQIHWWWYAGQDVFQFTQWAETQSSKPAAVVADAFQGRPSFKMVEHDGRLRAADIASGIAAKLKELATLRMRAITLEEEIRALQAQATV